MTAMKIDVMLVGGGDHFAWTAGDVLRCDDNPHSLAANLSAWLRDTTADGIWLWNAQLGKPDEQRSRELLSGRGDVWHAGLVLGAAGQPGMLDFVSPNWMLNCDPPTDREATSWRASASASLVRTNVLRQLGVPSDTFSTVAGAMIEWGHRAIMGGALMRHLPSLVQARAINAAPSLDDEVRFIAYRYGRTWARWAVLRAGMTGYATVPALMRALQRVPQRRPYDEPAPLKPRRPLAIPNLAAARVTVLIPTLNRYPYLRVVLSNLRAQTVRPLEIILVDQTPMEKRETTIAAEFADLPIRVIYQDEPGQCASRNAGLKVSKGDYVLFIDDDDELTPTLIEEHLRNLHRFDADVSSGVATEVGTAPLDADRRYVRASDVFPTNNTLTRREVLTRSGLFDLAFNRAPRADGELGMRVYLSGAFMVLDQGLAVLHHRAAEGGLRAHRARVITYRSSREQLMQRHLPHVSEIYLVSRYFTPRQQREMLWLRAFGTFSGRGSRVRKVAKVIASSLMLPDTVKQTIERRRTADEWLRVFPQIAKLDS